MSIPLHLRPANLVPQRVSVFALVSRGNRTLLLRKRHNGKWTLPGGRANPRESLGNALAREVREECGLQVLRSQAICAHIAQGTLYLYFACTVRGSPVPLEEMDRLRWATLLPRRHTPALSFASHHIPNLFQ